MNYISSVISTQIEPETGFLNHILIINEKIVATSIYIDVIYEAHALYLEVLKSG